jgi:hypothetical protein
MDYVKQLEAANEELQKKLSEALAANEKLNAATPTWWEDVMPTWTTATAKDKNHRFSNGVVLFANICFSKHLGGWEVDSNIEHFHVDYKYRTLAQAKSAVEKAYTEAVKIANDGPIFIGS